MTAETEQNVPLIDIIPMRELRHDSEINPASPLPDIRWDCLTLYNQGGMVLARSKGYPKNTTIPLTYRGITFMATPGYKDSTISVEWGSLVDFIETQ